MKKLLSILLSLSIVFASITTIAATNELVSSAAIRDGVVNVSGYGKNVSIFLLNPGKTVSQIETSLTKEAFNQTVNYVELVNTKYAKSYSLSFRVNNYVSEEAYTLYVKSDTDSKTITLEGTKYIYVSTVGNDTTGDGSKANPYATIDKAREEARAYVGEKPIDIIISSGKYTVDSTISFTSADSGTADCPITYRAANNAKVVINGDTTLSASDFTKVSDSTILSKVNKATADNLYVIDLTKYNVSTGIAEYLTSQVKADLGTSPILKLNNNRQDLARCPNKGYKVIENVYDADGTEQKRVERGNVLSLTLADATSAQLEAWAGAENAYIEGWTSYDWYHEWEKITSVDTKAGRIVIDPNTQYGAAQGFRGSIINLIEELDTPGEFYISKDMKLYYYPPYKLTSKDTITIASCANEFIKMNGCEYISFKNISFCDNAAKKDAVVVDNSSNISFTGCSFDDIGGRGIALTSTTDTSVDKCEFSNTGLQGVSFSKCGSRTTLTASNDSVTNSVFSFGGFNRGNNVQGGIYIMDACVGVEVKNNIFHNMANSAIRYEGNNNFIANNEFYNCVNDAADAGAIYSGRSFSEYGTIIKNNYFHNIGNIEFDNQYDIGAVFWDDNHSGNAFIGNLVDMGNRDKDTAGIRVGGGTNNVVRGNVFTNATTGIRTESGMTMPDNIFFSDSSFYTTKQYTSFLNATTGEVTNAQNITSDDWLEAFKTAFPGIMTNYSYINNKAYKRTTELSSNVLFDNDANYYKYNRSNIIGSGDATPSSESAFVDYAGGDLRVTSAYKSQASLDDTVLDEAFSWDNIGISDTSIVDDYKAFDLLYPANGSKVDSSTTYLTWQASIMADSYTYEVATDSAFSNIVASGTTRYTQAVVDGLSDDGTYYWHVIAMGESRQLGFESRSSTFSFSLSGGLNIEKATYSATTNKVSYTISNSQDEDEALSIVAALYDASGALVGANITAVNVVAGSSASGSLTLGGFVGKGGKTLKLIFLKDLESLLPIAPTKTFNYTK